MLIDSLMYAAICSSESTSRPGKNSPAFHSSNAAAAPISRVMWMLSISVSRSSGSER